VRTQLGTGANGSGCGSDPPSRTKLGTALRKIFVRVFVFVFVEPHKPKTATRRADALSLLG
jgi:hypothetical protein